MKFFANYEADAVIREDGRGTRYMKTIDNPYEVAVSKDCKAAWGIPAYGVFNKLEPITQEEYKGFGKTWRWSPRTGEKEKINIL